MLQKYAKLCCLLSVTTVTSGAPYVGAGAALAMLELPERSPVTLEHHSNWSARVHLGWQLGRSWGAELFYAPLGRFAYRQGNQSVQCADLKMTGAALWYAPFSTDRQARGFNWLLSVGASQITGAPQSLLADSKILWGTAVAYRFNRHWGARLMVENSRRNLNLASVALGFRFD